MSEIQKPRQDKREAWVISVVGYGEYEFVGTEAQAEKERARKSKWEMSPGRKWRKDHPLESDKIMVQMNALWAEGKGVPTRLFNKYRKARSAERTEAAQ